MSYLVAIDQGTSSTRAMLYSSSGELIQNSQYPITQHYPAAGWVEQDAEEIWQKTLQAIKDVISCVDSKKIVACGITNQRETTLLWDKKTGHCLSPAIVWQDRRTEKFCQNLKNDCQEIILAKTGLVIDPYFSASKIHWLLNHIKEANKLAKKEQLAFGTIDSFLIWRLTGGKKHLTDITNASRTMLFNIHEQIWDKELLAIFNIPFGILPEIRDCDAAFGEIDKRLFGRTMPITGVAGDQQAALIGQCCFTQGAMKATYGTGGFLLLNTGEDVISSQFKLLSTVAYRLQGKTAYGLEGGIYHAGTTIKWLRDELKLFSQASDTESLARSLSSNEGVYLIPSFTGLGAPHWLSRHGAIITGLSRTSTASHFARAALESVAYQTRDVLLAMRQDYQQPISCFRVDGGMAANSWFLQYLSSQCDLTIERPKDVETTARGAAMAAGLGSGLYTSLNELEEKWQCERSFIPSQDEQVNSWYNEWKNALRLICPN